MITHAFVSQSTVCLYVCLSSCPFVTFSVCLCVSMSVCVCLFAYVDVCFVYVDVLLLMCLCVYMFLSVYLLHCLLLSMCRSACLLMCFFFQCNLYPSVSDQFLCLYFCPPFCLYFYQMVCLSVCPSLCLFIRLSAFLPFAPTFHRSACLSLFRSVHRSVCSVYLSVSRSITEYLFFS